MNSLSKLNSITNWGNLHGRLSDYLDTKLIRLVLEEKTDLVWVFLASSVVNLLFLTPMLYMLQIFDRIYISKSILTLASISLIIGFFYITTLFGNIVRSKITISLGMKIEEKVNEPLFKSAMKNKLTNNDENPLKFAEDLTLVRQWFTGQAVFAAFDLPWVPFYVFVMFLLHPSLGYLSLALILFYTIAGLTVSRVMGTKDEIVKDEEYETNEFLYSKLRNNNVLRFYGLANAFKKSWLVSKRKFYLTFSKSEAFSGRIYHCMKQIRFFTASLALAAGATLVILDELTLASMIAASLLMTRTIAPIDQSVGVITRITVVREAFWRLEELICQGLVLVDKNKKFSADLDENKIKTVRMEDVSVKYQGNDVEILKDISLKINEGELVLITGINGVGKSTLTKILSGLLEHDGKVYLGEYDLSEIGGKDLNRLIGFLPQNVLLFPGTVSENISSLEVPESQKIINVTKKIGLHQFILRMPYGYETFLDGGRSFLSGGERQKIGLSRALYNDPKIIILDEPNTFLDQQSEQALLELMSKLKDEKKIIVVISHSDLLHPVADKIYSLEDGRLTDEKISLENKKK